jgi:hypothetical protein
MKRRSFLKKTTAAAAGSIVMPYILPSGRLFAQTGSQMADHVVYVLFAGGVRQQESVLQRYLDDSQGVNFAGNIMYNMLAGAPPQGKIVYGTDVPNQPSGIAPIPSILSAPLQTQGTLFPEVRATTAGHYAGLNTLLTGNTGVTQGLRQKPVFPTIFEYARRHAGFKATDVWFVGNSISGSTPLLDYSEDPNYGAQYGANFLCPNVTFGSLGDKHLSNAKIYHPEEELDPMYQMKYFLDNSFMSNGGFSVPNIGNTEEEKQEIKTFIRDMFQASQMGNIANPPVADNGDSRTVGWACEVIKRFKPKITVVNMSAVDGCHSNFTGYLKSLHRADHAVGHLWDFIQNQVPEMAGKTVIMATPEHGRNLDPNPIIDENDWYAYDHSDQNSMRVFTVMAGQNVPSNLVAGSETNQVGTTMDNVLTIADIFGFKQDVLNAGYISGSAQSLFDRI